MRATTLFRNLLQFPHTRVLAVDSICLAYWCTWRQRRPFPTAQAADVGSMTCSMLGLGTGGIWTRAGWRFFCATPCAGLTVLGAAWSSRWSLGPSRRSASRVTSRTMWPIWPNKQARRWWPKPCASRGAPSAPSSSGWCRGTEILAFSSRTSNTSASTSCRTGGTMSTSPSLSTTSRSGSSGTRGQERCDARLLLRRSRPGTNQQAQDRHHRHVRGLHRRGHLASATSADCLRPLPRSETRAGSTRRLGVRRSDSWRHRRTRATEEDQVPSAQESVEPIQAESERLSTLPKTNARLYRGYLLKIAICDILGRRQVNVVKQKLEEWISWARRSRLPSFKKVAATIKKYLTASWPLSPQAQ